MTDHQFEVFIDRLDKIVTLLELQTFVPEDVPNCEHRNAVDISVMGMRPGEKMHCNDCGEFFSRLEVKNV